MKTLLIILAVLVVGASGYFFVNNYFGQENNSSVSPSAFPEPADPNKVETIASPTITPNIGKCDYVENIGYNNGQIYKAIRGEEISKDLLPVGATYGIYLEYVDASISNPTFLNVIPMTFYNYITEDAAKKSFNTQQPSKYFECTFDEVRGSCRFIITENTKDKNKKNVQAEFSWLEFKTLKQIAVLELGGQGEDVGGVENRAKDKIGLFVRAYKNCEIKRD